MGNDIYNTCFNCLYAFRQAFKGKPCISIGADTKWILALYLKKLCNLLKYLRNVIVFHLSSLFPNKYDIGRERLGF